MIRRTVTRSAFAFAVAVFLSAAAHAELFRAYVAATGSDTNPCTLPQPCRLLPAALAVVASGGEIWMLDSANYNAATVTIGKSVSILAVPGAVGSVVAIGGPAISISAAGLKVALRNLVIVPFAGGGGTHGVSMTGASVLTIEGGLIANLPNHGVEVLGAGKLRIADSVIRDSGIYAVFLRDGATAEISGTKMLGNSGRRSRPDQFRRGDGAGNGERFDRVRRYLWHQRRRRHRCNGLLPRGRDSLHDRRHHMALDSEAFSSSAALVTVSGSTIAHNNRAWNIAGAGALIKSLGNNHIQDNTNAPIGTLTAAALQ